MAATELFAIQRTADVGRLVAYRDTVGHSALSPHSGNSQPTTAQRTDLSRDMDFRTIM